MAIFFTSDHHCGHKNIMTYTKRPFTEVHEMNKAMVAAWNAVVEPEDTVYHLGDIVWGNPKSMRAILDRLNGTIHFIRGNHDKIALKPACRTRFASISDILEIRVPDEDAPAGQQLIVMCHYAMRTWNSKHYGSWQLYGHSHGALPDDPCSRSMDVGVDTATPFTTPYSYEQVKALMAEKTWRPPFGNEAE